MFTYPVYLSSGDKLRKNSRKTPKYGTERQFYDKAVMVNFMFK